MVRPSRSRRLRGVIALGVGGLLCAVPVGGAAAVPTTPLVLPTASSFGNGNYVVTLVGDPIAKYDGTLPGLPRLTVTPGGGVDLRQVAAEKYRAFLLDTQTTIAKLVDAIPVQRYTVALNGFSAKLTAAQAQQLSATPGVLAVSKDTLRHIDSTEQADEAATTGVAEAATAGVAPAKGATTTADYLGLTGPKGV
ncbi:MAG: protease inhibitor I9 family protein, partial [Janthinobacterium lividum]